MFRKDTSGFYTYLGVPPDRENENKMLTDKIIKIYDEVNGIYGYRHIKLNLERRLNKTINLKRAYRLMKTSNLQTVIRKKKKKYVKSKPPITAENVLNRDFKSDAQNEKWLTDVTEFKLAIDNYMKFYNEKILQKN